MVIPSWSNVVASFALSQVLWKYQQNSHRMLGKPKTKMLFRMIVYYNRLNRKDISFQSQSKWKLTLCKIKFKLQPQIQKKTRVITVEWIWIKARNFLKLFPGTWIIGFPRRGTRGLPSNREDAKRAGMIPTTWLRSFADRRRVTNAQAPATAAPAKMPRMIHDPVVASGSAEEFNLGLMFQWFCKLFLLGVRRNDEAREMELGKCACFCYDFRMTKRRRLVCVEYGRGIWGRCFLSLMFVHQTDRRRLGVRVTTISFSLKLLRFSGFQNPALCLFLEC